VNAQFTLGSTYHDGNLVPKDYTQAVYWVTEGAKQGHVNSQFF
jgi:TPR repeat protein